MPIWLLTYWKYLAMAVLFAAGLAIGYVGAAGQCQRNILKHSDKAVAAQHKADKTAHNQATGVSKATEARRAADAAKVSPVIEKLAGAPEKAAACDLDQETLDLLTKAGS